MRVEHEWVYLMFSPKEKGINTKWKLIGLPVPRGVRAMPTMREAFLMPTTLGYLSRGTRRNKGWFVEDYNHTIHTSLPNELSTAEAKDAAKLILLSLKGAES